MADQVERRRELIRKYQQTDKFKEYKKQQYLEKVKNNYKLKTEKFCSLLHKKSGRSVKNEIDILNMIDECDDLKDIKKIYDNLLKLVEL